MDLSPANLETALARVAEAWRQVYPDTSANEMPEALRSASEPRKDRTMQCAWCLGEASGGRCPSCGLDSRQARQANEDLQRAAAKAPPGGAIFGVTMTSDGVRKAVAPSSSGRKEGATVVTPKDKDTVWAEIERGAASFTGDYPTKEQRIAAYMGANPHLYHEYQRAPRSEPTAPSPPPPAMTFAEAERAFRANPRSADAIWDLIGARAHALRASDPGITIEQARVRVMATEPDLGMRMYRAEALAR